MIEFNPPLIAIIIGMVACLIGGYVIKHTPSISERLTDYIPLMVAVLGGA